MLGLNKGDVHLVPHTSEWKKAFIDEKELLNTLIGEHVVDIQHIGSTAIDGIVAKPLLDIVIGVRSMEDVQKFDKHKLKAANYYHLGRVQIEGKKVFAKFSNLEVLTKTHVLHVVEYDGDWWHQHTFFRDYLNKNPESAKQYEILKKELAEEFPADERAYADRKKKFVDDIFLQRGE
ncbi:GrpB family protein [Filibacter tadaridae]|uniref:Dephospho-CoA kinase/protein folding accessory domain-containing protein n=1 Tax=Filibacter tadaridae TaxID=2483811 RepID=A0A3P5WJM8_9BACL|nr:GrpB family protein [Filibacter tadaridae]VDC21012.1 dephospho-CoA kinase/protein folding accessory domain-containing protein [Filibacter tadaridae]